MDVVAVFNQKGGVGKTTISVNLAVTLASIGFKTVFMDMDFQGDGTRQLWPGELPERTVYDLIARRCTADEAAIATGYPNLSLIASSRKLSLIEAGSDTAGWSQTELRESGFVHAAPDFLIIDCPPSLGRLAANALTAANFLVVPVTPTAFAIEGMKRTLDIFDAVRAGLNPELRHYRIALSMMDEKPISRVLAAELVKAQGDNMLPTKVPFDQDVNKAAASHVPAVLFNPDSDFTRALSTLAFEMMRTLGLELSAQAIAAMRERLAARHRELAPEIKALAAVAPAPAAEAEPAPAAAEAPPAATNGARGIVERHLKPFAIGGVIGAALGFVAGASL
jgi:chromosome partitioning protein